MLIGNRSSGFRFEVSLANATSSARLFREGVSHRFIIDDVRYSLQ